MNSTRTSKIHSDIKEAFKSKFFAVTLVLFWLMSATFYFYSNWSQKKQELAHKTMIDGQVELSSEAK